MDDFTRISDQIVVYNKNRLSPETEALLGAGIDTTEEAIAFLAGGYDPSSRTILTTALTFYISADNGDDTNDGTTLATAFRTNARLKQEISKYFLQGGSIEVNYEPDNVSDYDGFFLTNLDLTGTSGDIVFQSFGSKEVKAALLVGFRKIKSINIKITQIHLSGEFDSNFNGNIDFAFCDNLELRNVKLPFLNLLHCKNIILYQLTVGYSAESAFLGINFFRSENVEILDLSILNSCVVDFNYCFNIRGGSTLNIKTDDAISIAGQNAYSFTFRQTSNFRLTFGSTYLDSAERTRLARLNSCSNGTIGFGSFRQNEAGNGIFAEDVNLPVIEIIGSTFINFYKNSSFNFIPTNITGLVNNVTIDANSIVRIIDTSNNYANLEDFSFLPYDGALKIAPGGIINNINAHEVSFDNQNTDLTSTNLLDAIKELNDKINNLTP